MRRFRDTPLYRVYWALTSVKLTVWLLAAILAVLIWGTIFEAQKGTKAAQFLIYQSLWFDALLTFFGINLACCTVRRFKRKRSQLGFLTTHIGIMTILVGALISRNLGYEGQLIIPEGETRNYIIMDENALVVSTLAGDELVARQYDTVFDKLGGRTDVRSSFVFPGEDLDETEDLAILIDRYYPDARFEEELVNDLPETNPAIQVAILGWEGEQRATLMSRIPGRRSVALGSAQIGFTEAADQEAFAALMDEEEVAESDRLGRLRLVFAGGARFEISIDGNMGERLPVRGTDYAVRLLTLYPHFSIQEDHYASLSTSMVNPALLLDVIGPDDTPERHLLFAFHPDLSVSHHAEHDTLVTEARYLVEDTRHVHVEGEDPAAHGTRTTDAGGRVRIVRAPDGTLHALIGVPGGATRSTTLEVGEIVAYPEAGLEFWVAQSLDNARVVRNVVNQGTKEKNPAVHIRLTMAGESSEAWLVQGIPGEFRVGGRDFRVEYGFKRRELGFSVALEDFREITYPGIAMAQSFESDVVVSAPDASFHRKISMNNPLKFKGLKIFQSSFQRGAVETSIFSVASAPGIGVMYTGCFVLVLGLIVILFLKPYLIRSATRARKGPLVPAGAVSKGGEGRVA